MAICCSKHGRRSKFKWPDTFLIESSGRRETPESIAESKAREARKQNQTLARQHSNATPEEEEDNVADPEHEEHESEHRFLENDTGSDQDISEDDDFEDSIIDESSKISLYGRLLSNRNSCSLCSLCLFGTRFPLQEGVTLCADLFAAIKLLFALESCNLAL